MGGRRRARTWRGWWASLGSLPTGGGGLVCVLAGGVAFLVGDRDRARALVSTSASGASVLLLASSVVSPLRVVHCLGARSWGLREGSVVLH